MRIGIYDPYLDDLGGGEKYMLSIASCLASSHTVSLFWDNPEDLQKLKRQFSIDLEKVRLVKNIFSPGSGFFRRLLATRGYDAIIILSDGSIPMSLSKKLFIHLQQPLDRFNSGSFKGKIKLSAVTKIFCNSNYTKSFNEHRFHIKTVVVYPPVALFPKNIKKENFILTVGRYRTTDPATGIDDYKKFPVMIDSFKRMSKSGLKKWTFVIAVSVKKQDELRFLQLRRTALGFPIRFLVNQTNNQLWNIYSRAKIYWHAAGFGEDLIKYPQRAEHFGISTVEAMGAGAVPVVINAGGQREIVTDGENGYLWNTVDEQIQKTRSLINNDEVLLSLSGRAKKKALDFSPEMFCRNVKDLVEK